MDSLPLFVKPHRKIRHDLEHVSYDLLYPNQTFVLSYMHPLTPYRGLLLAYQVGNGKTYAAAALAHLYNTYGFGVTFLSHNVGAIDNFKREHEGFMTDHRLDGSKTCIEYMGLTKFVSRKPDISRQLVILDEAHNLRESATRYPEVKEILDRAKEIRILVITATPMIDQVNEIESLRHLIEKKAPVAYCRSKIIEVKTTYIGQDYGFGKIHTSMMKGKQLEMYKQAYSRRRNDIYSELRQLSLSAGLYDAELPLDEQSSKVAAMIEALVPGELTAVFSFYVLRGVYFMANALVAHGFEEWSVANDLHSHTRRFAIITGQTSQVAVAAILERFNSIANVDGSDIELIIGSSVMSEAITLKHVRHVHIMTPFWNYGQIEQAIGRVVRIGSHDGLPADKHQVNIHLHAAIQKPLPTFSLDPNHPNHPNHVVVNPNHVVMSSVKQVEDSGVDMKMFETAWRKQRAISNHLDKIADESIWPNDEWLTSGSCLSIPVPDGRMVFENHGWVWDLRNCFETNKSKISWCRVDRTKAIGYNTKNGQVLVGDLPHNIVVHEPYSEGMTAWVSCIDKQIRLSLLGTSVYKHKKRNKKTERRGRLISNMKPIELSVIAEELNTDPTRDSILSVLKSQGRFIEHQITVIDDLQQN